VTFWTSQKLEERIEAEQIVAPFDKKKVDCASYTLTLGGEAYITGEQTPGFLNRMFPCGNEIVAIPSGQFGFLICDEMIHIPKNAIGFISIKAAFKFNGLINVSGFHVDPGYSGRLIFGVYNAGPSTIQLKHGQDLFLLFLSDLDADSGKSRIKPGYIDIAPAIRNGMSSRVRTIDELKEDYDKLEKKVSGMLTRNSFFVALLSGVLFLLARLLFPGHSGG
tara:strand:- start:1212 stop:1874 length:663 start_codon:yes stop_codon:yes gene_type:complete